MNIIQRDIPDCFLLHHRTSPLYGSSSYWRCFHIRCISHVFILIVSWMTPFTISPFTGWTHSVEDWAFGFHFIYACLNLNINLNPILNWNASAVFRYLSCITVDTNVMSQYRYSIIGILILLPLWYFMPSASLKKNHSCWTAFDQWGQVGITMRRKFIIYRGEVINFLTIKLSRWWVDDNLGYKDQVRMANWLLLWLDGSMIQQY